MLAELLNLIGAVTITCLTVNYAPKLTNMLRPWAWLGIQTLAVAVFWGLFLIVTFAVRQLLKRLAEWLKWERLHWLVQGFGLVFGGLRGAWWCAFIFVVLSASGVPAIERSVTERSVVGSRTVGRAHTLIARVANKFPGTSHRGAQLVPSISAGAK